MHILGAIAEFEHGRIIERVRAGLTRARTLGKRLARRPLPISAAQFAAVNHLSLRDVAPGPRCRGKIEREGEERRLLTVAGPRLQRLMIGALETGMRRGELLALTWDDVNLERKEITVRADTSRAKTSRVPISARLAAVLEMARTALETLIDTGGPAAKLSDHERAALLASSYVFGDKAGSRWAPSNARGKRPS